MENAKSEVGRVCERLGIKDLESATSLTRRVLVCPVCHSTLEGPNYYCPKCKHSMRWSLEGKQIG